MAFSYDSKGGCMFVSGVPGTGKTATVRAVAETLRAERDSGALTHFKFVEINGMAMTSPHNVCVMPFTACCFCCCFLGNKIVNKNKNKGMCSCWTRFGSRAVLGRRRRTQQLCWRSTLRRPIRGARVWLFSLMNSISSGRASKTSCALLSFM